jgi:competence protein ComEA
VDPTAKPWRVLEDRTEPGSTGAAVAAAPASLGLPTVALAVGGVVVLIAVALILAFGAGANGSVLVEGGTPLGSADVMAVGAPGGPEATRIPDLVVEIVGAVEHPGVFNLPPGSRVGDLVQAAGGYGSRVDANRASLELNLAAPLNDGDQVRVPSRDDELPAGQTTTDGAPPTAGEAPGGTSGPLDLNAATSAELETLPGIGPVTAAKILTAREEQRFGAVEDLRTRGVLGEKTYEKVKDLVTVR